MRVAPLAQRAVVSAESRTDGKKPTRCEAGFGANVHSSDATSHTDTTTNLGDQVRIILICLFSSDPINPLIFRAPFQYDDINQKCPVD